MKSLMKIVVLCAGLFAIATAFADVPAGAPAGTTGLCKDGTYYSGATKKGACRGHKGVKDWYAAATDTSTTKSAAPAAAATPAATPAAAPSAKPATTKASSRSTATAAPGGGAGLVWVNSSSKVYHCSTDKWYGKTKKGEYMSEADAKAKGNKPDHGKACN